MEETKKVTIFGLIANIFLTLIKAFAGLTTGSIAIISDAINSFMDILSSVATMIAVKVSKKAPDQGHPFGYRRAEPVAALFIAILSGILAFQIFKTAATALITGQIVPVKTSLIAVIIILIAIFSKIFMSWYFHKVGKKYDSPSLVASSIDFRNDIMCSFIVLIGFLGTYINMHFLDDVAALFVAAIIAYSGYMIAIENIDYLMGKCPDDATLFEIRKRTLCVPGVKKIGEVKAHYVGHYIHVEIEVLVDKNLLTKDSHEISKKVKTTVEEIPHIDKAFIHIEPV